MHMFKGLYQMRISKAYVSPKALLRHTATMTAYGNDHPKKCPPRTGGQSDSPCYPDLCWKGLLGNNLVWGDTRIIEWFDNKETKSRDTEAVLANSAVPGNVPRHLTLITSYYFVLGGLSPAHAQKTSRHHLGISTIKFVHLNRQHRGKHLLLEVMTFEQYGYRCYTLVLGLRVTQRCQTFDLVGEI